MPDIKVERVFTPNGVPMGVGIGTTDDGTVGVIFIGERRLMAELRDGLANGLTPIVHDVPEWAIIDRVEL